MDGAPMPMSLWIGRICEEFPCYGPEEAYRAWLRAPSGWFEEILETRAFAAVKAMVDRAKSPKEHPDSPLTALVLAITEEQVLAERQNDAAAV